MHGRSGCSKGRNAQQVHGVSQSFSMQENRERERELGGRAGEKGACREEPGENGGRSWCVCSVRTGSPTMQCHALLLLSCLSVKMFTSCHHVPVLSLPPCVLPCLFPCLTPCPVCLVSCHTLCFVPPMHMPVLQLTKHINKEGNGSFLCCRETEEVKGVG